MSERYSKKFSEVKQATGEVHPMANGLAPTLLDEYLDIAKHIVSESVAIKADITALPESLERFLGPEFVKRVLEEAEVALAYGMASQAYMYDNVERFKDLKPGDKLPISFLDKWS